MRFHGEDDTATFFCRLLSPPGCNLHHPTFDFLCISKDLWHEGCFFLIMLYLVGGLEHDLYFPYIGNVWKCHHPNWLSYFSEGLKSPTRYNRTCLTWLFQTCSTSNRKKTYDLKLLYFVWSPPWHLYILLLANLLAFYLTYFLAFDLAFYLAYLLAFYLAYLLADVLAYLLADVLAYLLAYLLAYVLAYLLAFHLAFYLAYLLAYYLANLLAFYLAYLLAYYLANLLAFYLANILALYLAYLLAF